jgi:uncharacterized protein (TIGR00661 family)
MARILFGICGDGIGHASRSKATIDHLIENGHEIRIVSSKKGYDYLSEYYETLRIFGLQITNKDGEVIILDTVNETALNLLKYGLPTIENLLHLADSFKPELVITDFEPFVSVVSRIKRIPLISIDNQHVITHCNLQYPRAWRSDYLIAEAVCKAIINFAEHYFITSFFAPKLKKKDQAKVTLVGPILRNEILHQIPSDKNHIMVYMRSSERAQAMALLLEKYEGNTFFVYGLNGNSRREKNIIFKEHNVNEFYHDLAGAKAVITNGGHSLISESLYLGKPIYSNPTKRDFEQMSNGYYVEKLGYGIYELEPTISCLQTFLGNLETYKLNIKKDSANFNGNEQFYQKLDLKLNSILLPGIKPSGLKPKAVKKASRN